jgi:hypothetical protein
MKRQSYGRIIGLALISLSNIVIAQSRYEIESMRYRELQKKYSIPVAVLTNFYNDHPDADNVISTRYIAPAEIYEISFLSDGKEVQAFYQDGTVIEKPQIVAVGYHSTWEEFPETVKNKMTKYDPSLFKEFYVVEKDGLSDYYSLREVNNRQVLVKCSSDGLLSANVIYDGNRAARRESKYHPYYKTSYRSNPSISDYVFAKPKS